MAQNVMSKQQYDEWTQKSKKKLKLKITKNYNKRRDKAIDLITKFLMESLPNSQFQQNIRSTHNC